MALLTAGCTMAFNFFRLDSSVKMMLPSFLRSSVPSGKRICFPKVASILARAVVPGSTTLRAIMSASTTGTLEVLRRVETVDFPVAIPPVSPITIRYESETNYPSWNLRAYRASMKLVEVDQPVVGRMTWVRFPSRIQTFNRFSHILYLKSIP
jgi:hypothetical protein